jgi:hypothetical protein
MPRDGATIFSDLIGKLDVLRVSCSACGRNGSTFGFARRVADSIIFIIVSGVIRCA